jgi:hypothetical protein
MRIFINSLFQISNNTKIELQNYPLKQPNPFPRINEEVCKNGFCFTAATAANQLANMTIGLEQFIQAEW